MSEDIGKYICIDTPSLIERVFDNPGTSILKIPFNMLSKLLYAVAQRATELHDPQLDILMLRLNLYEVEHDKINDMILECEKLIQQKGK